MFNLHDDLDKFYQDHVRLGKVRRNELATFRDNSLTRLESGLDKLGEKRGRVYAYYADTRNQGGYAMDTLNQAANNDYDIDVGLIFEAGDLPDGAKAARERIRDAFIESGGQFKDPPNARSNAVTVWYASGQHLDFAIYRRSLRLDGSWLIEHASGDVWTPRDPDRMTNWFDERVRSRSPSGFGVTVASGQLRRIVRYLKYFARSRAQWRLPGGMILTTLTEECYQPHGHRDDVALRETLLAMARRLQAHRMVASPIDGSDLTAKDKRKREMDSLAAALFENVPKLDILFDPSCTRQQARNAWRQIFNHAFWEASNDPASRSMLRAATAAPASAAYVFPDHARAPTKPAGFG